MHFFPNFQTLLNSTNHLDIEFQIKNNFSLTVSKTLLYFSLLSSVADASLSFIPSIATFLVLFLSGSFQDLLFIPGVWQFHHGVCGALSTRRAGRFADALDLWI